MNKTYLLTGGTGFLGSILAVGIIRRGDRVIFLGRAKDGLPFEDRIKKILLSIDSKISLDKTEYFEIDLNKKLLDLPKNILDRFNGKIDAFWHLAANLSFKEKDKHQVFATNIDGLKNVLDLCSRLDAPVFYTSTAYVHGQRPGIVYENELIKPRRFNNAYEESKYRAEKIIQTWAKEYSGRFIIFRPSILIEKQRQTLSFYGYYAVVNSLYKLKKAMGKDPLRLFLPFIYSAKARLNLMPVDIAVKWMSEIVQNKQAIGRTFHLANPEPFSMECIINQTFQALNIQMPAFQVSKQLASLYFLFLYYISFVIFPLKRLARKFYYYRYYMTENNEYDMSNVKNFVKGDIYKEFNLGPNFISSVALDFVKKLEEDRIYG